MIELADIFRHYGPAYRQSVGDRLSPSQRQAMWAIEHCRTETLGGHVYVCDACEEVQYTYHSCRNRHCPKCQNERAEEWLAQQQAFRLPVPYFMVTFTLPAELRPVARRHPHLIYNLLFRAAADALQELAHDPRFVGGQIGLMGVLHTWNRDLTYHPHVHYLVPGGGLDRDRRTWQPSRQKFLVHVKPLSKLFRAKFRDGLKKTPLFARIPPQTWTKKWVVHSKPVDRGSEALRYLAPYVFRVAISNNRIVKLEHDQVTFRYQASDTGLTQFCTLPAETFIGRFLQHVLPKGFVKVRYYGFFAPSNRAVLAQIRSLLTGADPTRPTPDLLQLAPVPECSFHCPQCGQPMRPQQTIRPARPKPP
jgi:hypothetical protein